jgi:uncharacterized HAD superfamily protein
LITIVIDLDGTLCNCEHRQIHAQNAEWDKFHEGLVDDLPNQDTVAFLDIIKGASKFVQVIACTGRNEAFRKLTLDWFFRYDIHVDVLLMRPDGDFTSDHELKPAMLQEHFGGSKEEVLRKVQFVLDDRDKVVDAWREYGLPCWQVRPGGY